MLPYGKQTIDEDDIAAVVAVLRSDWLTTGPCIEQFEAAFAEKTQSAHAIAVNSGTAALHAAMVACDISAGDEVIVPAITFVATANVVVYQGATPVFADIRPDTLLIDVQDVRRKITRKTKAIIAMDYAGQPCDYFALQQIADEYGLVLIADACHSLGASYQGRKVGSLTDFSCFSLHPVKPITAGEGGVVTTNNALAAARIRSFRNHGITTDHRQREAHGTFVYGMTSLGFNYRLTDIQCALAHSQLNKLDQFRNRRNEIAQRYDQSLTSISGASPLKKLDDIEHGWHLYVVRWNEHVTGTSRENAFRDLRRQNINANVHYLPVYRHPFYQQRMDLEQVRCHVADDVYDELLTLPIFPEMELNQVDQVVDALVTTTNATASAA